ncbi:MAG: hypothetical protein M1833_003794 [Piccolia ochrophora]|nr:MAG: hypothetical protein M1833_003794 [Piccolia ochrophora]
MATIMEQNTGKEREGGDDQDEKEGGDEGDESSGGGSEQQPDSKNAADSNEGEDAPNNDEESKESSDDSASEGEDDQAQDTPDTSDDESSGGKGSDSGVRFKGPVKGGPKEHNINRYPDAKGGTKKRLESTYGRKQGQAEEDPNEAPGNDRGGSTSKTPVKGSQSGKQEGVSNTDTKHSYDLDNDNSRSRKPEGPETAKTKGTIDPSRPQV